MGDQPQRLPDWALAPIDSFLDDVPEKTIRQLIAMLIGAGLIFSAVAFFALPDGTPIAIQARVGTSVQAVGGVWAWFGRPILAIRLVVAATWLLGAFSMFLTDGGTSAGSGNFLVASLLSCFVLGLRSSVIVIAASLITSAAALRLEITGGLPAGGQTSPLLLQWLSNTTTYAVAVCILWLSMNSTRQALSRARKSESMHRLVAEHTDEFVWSMRSDGKFIYASPSVERIFGWTPEEMLERRAEQNQLVGDAPDVAALIQDTIARGENTLRYEGQQLDRNDEPTWCEFAVTLVLDESGEMVGLNGVTRDITERVRNEKKRLELEEQFRQSQKMEAIGRLAGGIAHDFNNYLTVILGNAELLGEDLDAKEGSPVREIEEAAVRSSELTRQLLAYSRKQVMQPVVLDMNRLIRDADRLFRRVLGEDIEIETASADGLGRIKVDPAQLDQVILNLAVNARQAMPDGGKLTIETGNVYVDAELADRLFGVEPGPYVMLAVSDTGVGMDQETIDQIFDPFFTTRPGTGTGLGLSTVHGIVSQSGGAIRAYSEVGEGTTFRIYLPRVSEESDAIRDPAPRTASDAHPLDMTVMVVEDQESVGRVIASMLEPRGCRVLLVSTGEESLELASERYEEIDLVITDLVLPGMNGAEVGAALRERHALPVLYMSGFTENGIVHRGMLDPGHVLLQKPFTSKHLFRKIEEVLGN